MVISSEVRMGQYSDDDHREDAPHFISWHSLANFRLTPYLVWGLFQKCITVRQEIRLKNLRCRQSPGAHIRNKCALILETDPPPGFSMKSFIN